MNYLDRAIKDGYAYISGTEGKQKITYVTSDNRSENYEDPEEKVRAEFWAELIYQYEYPANRIKVEVTIPDRLPTDRADIVVFRDDECKRPYTVVECKKDGVTDAEFNQAIEQGVGNATWVKLRADYVVIIAGGTRRILDVTDKYGTFEREQNILADLPKAYGKPQEFRFYKGGVNSKGEKVSDIAPVEREELIAAIRKCHQTLWGGGRLSPPTAFGELCKLIFVKISDEQKPRKEGEPYQFQIKTHEPSSKLAERINTLYDEQKIKDPEVFTDSIKVDDRVLRTVVSHLEAINLNKTDLDVKGVAFEQFMDGFFKGDFGQYFTPRPIIEFAVEMMKPEHDWDVLDPACGSGGFLLHALDYMRREAGEYYDKKTQAVDHFNYWHDFAAKHLFGIEINDEIARVAKMNMIVHDDGHTNVISFDALDSIDKMHNHNQGFAKDKFDLILTNPPFGSTINLAEKPYLAGYNLGNTYDKKGKAKPRKNQSSEILFVERIWEFLKPGIGKAAIVLPDGILTNSSSQYVRDFILEKFQLLAVVSLPQSAFAHFGAGVKASLIFVRKRKVDEKPDDNEAIFMAAPENIGYDATGRTNPDSQLPKIVKQYEKFKENPAPFFV
jgi:type I restriction enzyme M protein